MDLFKFIDIFFKRGDAYDKLSDYEKSKNAFMLNRFLSIAFPTQINVMQLMKINTINVIDYWHRFLTIKYTKTPPWVYTKTKKNKDIIQEDATKKWMPNQETRNEYIKMYNLSYREYDDAMKLFPDKMIEDLKNLEQTLKSKIIKEK